MVRRERLNASSPSLTITASGWLSLLAATARLPLLPVRHDLFSPHFRGEFLHPCLRSEPDAVLQRHFPSEVPQSV